MPGFIFYEGPSMIDGNPIVGIATYDTENRKTGDLVQTWIMRSDINPIDAINTGKDESICGSCPLRGRIADVAERTKKISKFNTLTVNKGRGCYVSIQQAPLSIYNTYKKGNYKVLSDESASRNFKNRGLRYGSYGDPVAIPQNNWGMLRKNCTGKAKPGYTHQWRDKKFSSWSKFIMASTHSVLENNLAQSMGWRTFRTISNVSDRYEKEIICPASEEGEDKATCATCGACNGRRDMSDVRHSVVIVAHGGDGKLGSALNVIHIASK
jgi:hypothetical protein